MSKRELMAELIDEIKDCRRCLLWKDAKNPVPGEGSLHAPLMLIGEAPGYWEDVKGRPFIGAAGRVLDEILSSINLKRDDVYIGNVVKHRPPMNRNPRQDEVKACTPYLDKQIQIIKPDIIVTLGRHSTKYILSRVSISINGITRARGRIYKTKLLGLPVKIIPTFHPAAALYNPKYKGKIEEDFERIKRELALTDKVP